MCQRKQELQLTAMFRTVVHINGVFNGISQQVNHLETHSLLLSHANVARIQLSSHANVSRIQSKPFASKSGFYCSQSTYLDDGCDQTSLCRHGNGNISCRPLLKLTSVPHAIHVGKATERNGDRFYYEVINRKLDPLCTEQASLEYTWLVGLKQSCEN